jgi:hypothetical protein
MSLAAAIRCCETNLPMARAIGSDRPGWCDVVKVTAPPGSRGVDGLLAESSRRLRRVNPLRAQPAQHEGAVLVDLHPAQQRQEYGQIPDALVVDATSSNGASIRGTKPGWRSPTGTTSR